jgi:dipeptidyl aminopeptidase/acylaminoacyl peptidase
MTEANSPPEETRMSFPSPHAAPCIGLAAWLLAAAAGPAIAQQAGEGEAAKAVAQTPLIPRALLFGNPDKAATKISPDGKSLSYLASVDGVLNVWVGPVSDPAKATPVTHDKKRGIRFYFWAYTSGDILYIQDADGDENWHIYRADLARGRIDDLTPLKKVNARIQGVSHKFPAEILISLNDRDPKFHDVYRLNLKTGKRELLQQNDGFKEIITDDDYRVRLASKLEPDGSNLYLEPDGKGGWKDFLRVPMADDLTTRLAGFDKTGGVVYLIDSRGRDTGAFTTLDLKTRQQSVVAADPRADASGVLVHPTERTIEAVSFPYERVRWVFKDPTVEADFKKLAKVSDGEVSVASRTLDDKTWVVGFQTDNGPTRFYLFDRAAGKARFLFSDRKALEGLPLQTMRPVVVKSRDGMDLVCYLTLPPGSDGAAKGRPARPLPMVLDVHGGPWGRDMWGLNPTHQLLANRGYAVLSVNFRGSTGFGKKFVNAGNREWAAKMHDDLIDAVDWAIGQKIADPAKVAIMGGSYGGYATLVGMTFTPEKFACGVDIVGPSNLVTLLKTTPTYWAPMLQMLKDRVGDYTTEEGRKFLAERSPLTYASKIRRPLLIGQGANDPRVKQAESDQIVQAMKEHKIPVTYVLFPDEGHGFARPPNRLAFYAVTEAFLAQHLGGRYEPIGTAFDGSTITVPTGATGVPALPEALKRHATQK